MAQKILIFAWAFDFTYNLGGNDYFKIQKGRALIPEKFDSPELVANLEQHFGPGFTYEDYDPANPNHYLTPINQGGAFGSDRANNMVQGPITTGSISNGSANPAVQELDSQLAQALASGAEAVNELVAGAPEVLEGAGFVAPTAHKIPKAK